MRHHVNTKADLVDDLRQLHEKVDCLERAALEHQKTEEALQAGRIQLADAMELAKIVYWEVDLATMEFVFNDAFYTFYGTTAEQEGGYRMSREEYARRFLRPDDAPAFEEVKARRLASKDREFHSDMEHLVVRRDGEVRHILARVHVIRDARGTTVRHHGANQDITDRKKAEEALRESEELYRIAIESCNDGVAIVRDDKHLFVNQKLIDMFGYPKQEVMDMSLFTMTHPDDRETVARRIQDGMEKKETTGSYEFRAVTKDGRVKYIEASVTDIVYRGQGAGLVYLKDVTEEWNRRRERETTLALLKVLSGQVEIDDTIGETMAILQRWVGCEAAGVRLQAGDDFPYAVATGFSPEFVKLESSLHARGLDGEALKDANGSPLLRCRCGAVITGRREPGIGSFGVSGSFWTEGAEPEKPCPFDGCREEGYHSVALIPVRNGGRPLGLLQFNDRRRGLFTPEKITFLENAAEQIAIALSQRKTQKALAISEKRFRDISEAAGEFLLETDAKGRFTFVSDRSWELLGCDPKELIGRTLFDLVLASGGHREQLYFLDHFQKKTGFRDHEQKVVMKSGRTVWLNVTAVPVHDARGAFVGYRGAAMDITQRKRAEEKLLHDALYDELTGLPNRSLFMDRLGHALKRSNRRESGSCAVFFLDLDRFKVVNDSLGHLAGDKLLKEAARRLESCIRPGDTAARLGGDEFVMLFEDVDEIDVAKGIAERIQETLSAPVVIEGSEIRCSASIGIALASSDYTIPEEVLRDADITMYRAKARGKACYEVFDPKMRLEAAALLQLENELRRSLELDELRIHYQPIVDLLDEKTLGFEALLRWQHPHRGLVLPDDFIPLAEETGLIVPIGEWTLQKVCSQMKAWRDRGLGPMRVAVNISAVQLRQADFVEVLERIVRETGMEPELLDLEITESVLMDHNKATEEKLLKLRGLGVRICLDDFGTGYSSLSYLQGLPIDVLKIDRSFTKNLSNSIENNKIVETILMLGKNLGANVIAEGIETHEQLDYLRAIECHSGQGFFFSKPVDEKALEAIIGIVS